MICNGYYNDLESLEEFSKELTLDINSISDKDRLPEIESIKKRLFYLINHIMIAEQVLEQKKMENQALIGYIEIFYQNNKK